MRIGNIDLIKRLFVFLGLGLLLFSSLNTMLIAQDYGNTWNDGNVTASVFIRQVVWTGDRFVAAGNDGVVYKSTNGSTWSKVSTPAGTSDHLFAIAQGNGILVAVGRDGLCMRSTNNGDAWTITSARDLYGTEDLFGVAFGNNIFLAVGESGTLWRSEDGVTWTRKSTSLYPRAITFGGGIFVFGCVNGAVYRTTDGTTLTNSGNIGTAVRSLCYGNSMFLAVGRKIVTSSNGSSWTTRINLDDYGIADQLYSVATAPNTFIAAGEHGLMLNSADAVTWREGNSGSKRFITGMIYGNGVVAAVGNGGIRPGFPDAFYLYSTHYSPEGGTPPPILEPGGGGGTDPTITVTYPNGGETLEGGTTVNVTWTGSTSFTKVDIEYFDGSDWVAMVTGTADDGVHPWTVPNISTTAARIWMKGYSDSGNPADYSNSTFTIVPSGGLETIEITSPNGGETLTGNTNHEITWTSSTTFDSVDIEYYDGSDWNVVVTGTEDDGSYTWNVPSISTSKAQIWIKGWSSINNPTDYSDSTFTIIAQLPGSITVTSPNGGEVWAKNSTENITWTSSGEVGNVKISYSTNNGVDWNNIVSSTANDGSYPWTLPNTISDNCLVKINDVSNTLISDVSNNIFSIGGPAQIVLDRTRLNFGYAKNGAEPCPQTLFISNGGGGTLDWTAEADVSWLNLNPASGNNNGASIMVNIDASGLNNGTYTGTITISDPAVENSPQMVEVYLVVKNGSQDQAPFGDFATPQDGTTGMSGSIAVTGWVLDDICLDSVKIYREVNGELSYIGDATFVEGARPDVAQSYPEYPNNTRAGWGYMLLSNFLPDGQLILKAIATDNAGHQVTLGTKNLTLDNANATGPFGAIDFPEQGGSASGSKYRNSGWALTPQPNTIPTNGSTINVFIDGVLVGNVTYNLYREDIATLFPGYNNSNGSWGYLDIDTTAYSNGVHTISWSVTDNGNNSDGIGSRYFSIQNSGGAQRASSRSQQGYPSYIPVDNYGLVKVKKGYNLKAEASQLIPSDEGLINLETRELERLEIQLGGSILSGYMRAGDKIDKLPVGSTIKSGQGVFYWQLCPGFLGIYDLEFVVRKTSGELSLKRIRINVAPATLKKD